MKTFILITSFVLAPMVSAAADLPTFFNYQGGLTDASGAPVNADLPVEVRLYDSLMAGLGSGTDDPHVVYAERHASVRIEKGTFSVGIGKGAPLDARWSGLPVAAIAEKENLYLEVWIDGERLSPRQRIGASPAALFAATARYADRLTHLPAITEAMMPSYGAEKIVSGAFTQAQIPVLSPLWFTSGSLAEAVVPALDAGKFVTSGSAKIQPAILPHDMSAAKVSGSALSPERLPDGLLMDTDVAIGSGTLGNLQMVTMPAGFSSDECKIVVSAASLPGTAEDGLQYLGITLDRDNIVTCMYDGNEHEEQPCTVNYIYICKKAG